MWYTGDVMDPDVEFDNGTWDRDQLVIWRRFYGDLCEDIQLRLDKAATMPDVPAYTDLVKRRLQGAQARLAIVEQRLAALRN